MLRDEGKMLKIIEPYLKALGSRTDLWWLLSVDFPMLIVIIISAYPH